MTDSPSPKRQRTGEKNDVSPGIDSEKLQNVLERVGEVDTEMEAENEKLAREMIALETKYNIAKRPLFEKRSKLLREIPGFWKQVISNHAYLAHTITESDEKVMEFLADLDVTFIDNKGSFKVELIFGENPIIGKCTLWKQITYMEDSEPEISAGEITWKSANEAKEASDKYSFITSFASTEDDHDVAEHIKDELWKNPIEYYLEEGSDEEEGVENEDDEGEDEDDESADDNN